MFCGQGLFRGREERGLPEGKAGGGDKGRPPRGQALGAARRRLAGGMRRRRGRAALRGSEAAGT